MKKIGMLLAVLAGVVALTSSANAASSACSSIADPMKRLACYDKAANGAAPSVNPAWDTASNAKPAKATAKALPPATSAPRSWVAADVGFYGSFRNVPGVTPFAPPFSGPHHVDTSPGFIGLFSVSTVTNPHDTPVSLGGGANYAWGYWLDPRRTAAIQGSAFFGLGYANTHSAQADTLTFINTTPDVFVGLFDDNTTVAAGGIWDVLYGTDVNYRMNVPHSQYFPYFPDDTKFDVLVGWRYIGLDEITFSSSSIFQRPYQQALGLPSPFNQTLVNSSRPKIVSVWNNFIGPQTGFNVEQHWGSYWVESENKVAVGATIEPMWTGPSAVSTTPTQSIFLAGIPLQVSNGAPPVTGTGHSTVDIKAAFTVVPNGTFKIGYDISDQRSLTLAYNYLYMSQVGLIGYQFPSPGSPSIRQSSYFAQGITLGYKEKF
jgi:hypothetical protein